MEPVDFGSLRVIDGGMSPDEFLDSWVVAGALIVLGGFILVRLDGSRGVIPSYRRARDRA